MYVEFSSSPAGPLLNTGFHFNVGNWPGHVEPAGVKTGSCDWLLSSTALKQTSASEGIFLSVAHWYPPNTSCNYHIQGVENEIVRLYFPRWDGLPLNLTPFNLSPYLCSHRHIALKWTTRKLKICLNFQQLPVDFISGNIWLYHNAIFRAALSAEY